MEIPFLVWFFALYIIRPTKQKEYIFCNERYNLPIGKKNDFSIGTFIIKEMMLYYSICNWYIVPSMLTSGCM